MPALVCPPLQERYTYLTNITRIRQLVDTYSTIHNSTWLQGGAARHTSHACADTLMIASWALRQTDACNTQTLMFPVLTMPVTVVAMMPAAHLTDSPCAHSCYCRSHMLWHLAILWFPSWGAPPAGCALRCTCPVLLC
jgi:multisubunit Na+/H+ antiporter MnhG subunit